MPRYDAFADVTAPIAKSPWPAGGGTFDSDLDRLQGLLAACAVADKTWKDQTSGGLGAALNLWVADDELGLSQFFKQLLSTAWSRLPIAERASARELYGTVELPTAEVQPRGKAGLTEST